RRRERLPGHAGRARGHPRPPPAHRGRRGAREGRTCEGTAALMLAGMSLGTDITRYSRGVMPRVAIIAIIFLPLMYGALYLWAFWNPFNEVDQIPAALVNSDRGAEVEGEKLNAGDQVVDALLESKQLDLTVVDHDE